ncbi:hypothetical protein TNCV_3336701 [Trichonephila clavipes]|nr:hypothetical protein TNCV_3336701 [Trichonephila clavipes]
MSNAAPVPTPSEMGNIMKKNDKDRKGCKKERKPRGKPELSKTFSSESKRRSANSFSDECVMRQDWGSRSTNRDSCPKTLGSGERRDRFGHLPSKSPLTLSRTRTYVTYQEEEQKNKQMSVGFIDARANP